VDGPHPPPDLSLWQTLRTTTEGGKRVRPRLLTATYDALAGPCSPAPRDVVDRVADAVELLHVAFLAHDDVIDDDEYRRGRANVAGVYAARARSTGAAEDAAHDVGAAAGLLAGDLALAGAVRDVALCGADPVLTARLLDLMDEALHVTADGELRDVWADAHRGAGLEDVLLTAERKTAAYSFQLPMRLGAALAGRGDLDDRLATIGRHLGVAFQVRDDVLGTFGDPARTGKPASTDLREGRCTVLVALARGTDVWPRLAPLVGRADATDADLDLARTLLEECGARRTAEDLAGRFEQAALRTATGIGLDAAVAAVLGHAAPTTSAGTAVQAA